VNPLLTEFDDENKPFAVFGTRAGLWVPPEVEIKRLPAIALYADPSDIVLCIRYPIPTHWSTELTVREVEALKEAGWPTESWPQARWLEVRAVIDPTVLQVMGWNAADWGPRVSAIDGLALQEIGWQRKVLDPYTETSTLLDAFLRLAEPETLDDDTLEAYAQRVAQFVTTWGPLWVCRNYSHTGFCHWSGRGVIERPENPCAWSPTEEIREFHPHARRVRAVLEAASALRTDRPIPKKLLPWLRMPATASIAEQWDQLAFVVNGALWAHGGATIDLRVRQGSGLGLVIHSGTSFLGAVWMQVAQALGNAKGVLQCDSCARWYFRTGRRPKRGQKQFCPECKKNDRGSKAAYAQRKREQLRGIQRRESRLDYTPECAS
jgi:hypothetical protein